MSAALVALLKKAAVSVAADKELREALWVILGIVIFILTIFTFFTHIILSPINALLEGFNENELDNLYEIRDSFDCGDSEVILNDEKYLEVTYSLNGQYVLPISTGFRITCPFGPRKHPISKRYGFHHGIDLGASIGTPVHPFMDGTIEKVYYSQVYGKVVFIDHGEGIQSRYAHLNSFNCEEGDEIFVEDILGYVGNTGQSTGPHLHFEIRLDEKAINPAFVFETEDNHHRDNRIYGGN